MRQKEEHIDIHKYDSIQHILDTLKARGITEEQYKDIKLEYEQDYSGCYYESDYPNVEMKFVWYTKL